MPTPRPHLFAARVACLPRVACSNKSVGRGIAAAATIITTCSSAGGNNGNNARKAWLEQLSAASTTYNGIFMTFSLRLRLSVVLSAPRSMQWNWDRPRVEFWHFGSRTSRSCLPISRGCCCCSLTLKTFHPN